MMLYKKYMNFLKILGILFGTFTFIIIFVVIFTTKIIPSIVTNQNFLNYIEDSAKKQFNIDLAIKNPKLISDKTILEFDADLIEIKKENINYLTAKKITTKISLEKIFKKRIILKKAGADYIFADIDKLLTLLPKQEKKVAKKSEWKLRWFRSLIYLKDFNIIYSLSKDVRIDVSGKFMITENRNPKYAHYDIKVTTTKNNEKITLKLNDNNSVYIKDKIFKIDNGIISLNDSKITVNAQLDEKNNYSANVNSKNFALENAISIINSNIIIPNGSDIISYFKDIKGKSDFNVTFKNSGMSGEIRIFDSGLKIIALNNIPITMKNGLAKITPTKIELVDFNGFYGENQKNKITADGSIIDYTKSVNTDLLVKCSATDELLKKYISKVAGCPLTLTADCNAFAKIKSVYNKIDIQWMFKLPKGIDILVDGASISPINYDRVLTSDIEIDKNILSIKKINYYIASTIDKNSKGKIKPILTIDGNFDLAKNCELQDIGFVIPKPLPSEFLNLFVGQKFFKKGTISGNLKLINQNNSPKFVGNLQMDKVLIPSQRISINHAGLTTKENNINLTANGKFKRSNYKFSGNIKNTALLPIIVKNASMTIDDIDVEKVLTSFNNQNTENISDIKKITEENDNDDNFVFDTNLIVVENSSLKILKGKYKDLTFGNVDATMKLNKQGILTLHSNRFDFADGISTLRAICDLKKHDYQIRLGVREVDSNKIATTLLALPNEISGKMSGLIILHTNDSLKLNGEIKFSMKNGTIGKIGLVEYILKFTTLFRNPLAMISPSTVFDIVNIPDGKFDNIEGELKLDNNVAKKIVIKSTAPLLATFVIGNYNIEKGDASLRIYTKFSTNTKGLAGIMRNISLNGLANIIPLGSNNVKNYYEAELKMLPKIDADDKDCQVFLTTVDGDIQNNNYISSLKKIE